MSARHSGIDPSILFDLPRSPGTYVLVLKLHWESVIDVGGLGELTFPAGICLYCGSALGPGGLAARIAHHTRFPEQPRWHIDYLRFAASPVEVWYTEVDERLEHAWAGILAGIEGVEEAVAGFGSSDCLCSSHLFRSDMDDIFDIFSRLAGSGVTRAAAIRESG
jgi:Uri superfamily endonuclease